MRIILTLSCLYGFTVFLSSQTPIGGVINDYASVTALENNDCNAVITIPESAPFSHGDKVLIVQMQGAIVEESNSATFGTITELHAAGLYEFNEIIALSGNQLTLAYPLMNTYVPSDGLQLIRVPVYEQAIVVETLEAQAWDGITGGVLALEVNGTLTLFADIDLSGQGFRGGIAETIAGNDCSWLNEEDDYFYGANNWRGAAKGEGIASLPMEKQYGKGPQANGGGGGNDHNSGGGGGALFAAGGNGGKNEEPSFFGCDGNHPGLGGKGITITEQRLFMGGGGGAGHENNEVGTDGANGGGIILIDADSLIANSFTIAANGQSPVDGGGDGAGGAGAAGMVVLLAEYLSEELNISANGGNGGLINNNNAQRCHGPGGGGSGGQILINFPVESGYDLQTNGGAAGTGTQSSSCTDGPNGATPGTNGSIQNISALVHSADNISVPIADFQFSYLSNNTIQFLNTSMQYDGLSWNFAALGMSTIEDPEFTFPEAGMYEVTLIASTSCAADTIVQSVTIEAMDPLIVAFTGDTTAGCVPHTVQFTNQSSGSYDSLLWTFAGGNPSTSTNQNPLVVYDAPGTYEVQLELFGPNGNALLTEPAYVEVLPAAMADFSFSINENTVVFTNSSTNATAYLWGFGDGTAVSSEESPSHTFDEAGTYEVMLIASSTCGSDTLLQTLTIEDSNPLSAAYSYDDGNGCAPHLVQFQNQSSGSYDSLLWTFEGGIPATSTDQNPLVLYETPGAYDVQLELNGPGGSAAITETGLIEVFPAVEAIFGYNLDDNTVEFINLSTNATAYQWDFGDGSPFSFAEHPSHSYTNPGNYNVTLIATSPYCGKAVTESIFVDFTSQAEEPAPAQIRVFPNPVRDELHLETPVGNDNYSLVLCSLTGTRLSPFVQRNTTEIVLDFRPFGPGIYFLTLRHQLQTQVFKIVKVN